jgi:hypothetical protein
MGKFRARHCPRCSYYLGFSIVKPAFKNKETSVTSFCLNCNYKLPVRGIIRGIRRASSPLRRGALRLASMTKGEATPSLESGQVDAAENSLAPSDYARHLRVIGQDLEGLRLETFNLECTGDAYLVWSRPGGTDLVEGSPLSRLSKTRLQKLWKNTSRTRSYGQEELVTLPSSVQAKRYRYSLSDIDRMEHESRSRRYPKPGVTDGRSLSQLLRTVGAIVGQRHGRLLGISWQDFSVSVVVETTQGQREIDVFRPDNLYDLWVRMYLRRDNRALSDFPR